MKTSNIYSSNLLIDILKEIFLFPFWWYSIGLIKFIISLRNFIVNREKGLALFVWIKNIFVPMYGQRDFQGIIISIFIRTLQIIIRSIIMFFWLIVVIALFWVWLLAPIFIIYQIIWQLFL